jgi:hypothetical protein
VPFATGVERCGLPGTGLGDTAVLIVYWGEVAMARAVLGGMLVCLLALAGCGAYLADVGRLRSDLRTAGYEAGQIQHSTSKGTSYLTIAVVTDGEPTGEDAERVAEVAWTTFPREIERLLISVNENIVLDETEDELLRRFGARPEGLVATGDGGNPVIVILVASGAAVVLAAVMVLLWRRGLRPPPPVAPPGYQPGGLPPYPWRPPRG